MAHRNTNTEKYYNDSFLNLEAGEKLMYYYLNDNVDIAGFLNISYRKISLDIGLKQEKIKTYLDSMGEMDLLIWSDDREMVWFKPFLEEQNNYPINPANNCHKGILTKFKQRLVSFSNSVDEFEKIKVVYKRDSQSPVQALSLIDFLEHTW